eukprot:30490-Pelagococcus_subviridis.AAC.1
MTSALGRPSAPANVIAIHRAWSSATWGLGSFHTSERRGGVERRQLEMKGVEAGDRNRGVGGERRRE